MLTQLLAVGCGGFLGAVSRFLLSAWTVKLVGDKLPWGTLVVNVLGCLLIGAAAQLALTRPWMTPTWRLIVISGFLGSLTTFSTFGYETLALAEAGRFRDAALSVLLNMLLGLGAVALGRAVIHP